jgi:hypothetical protein
LYFPFGFIYLKDLIFLNILIFFYKFTNKVMFKRIVEFGEGIVLCYNKQNAMRMTNQVSPILTYHIFQIIVDYLSYVISTCVLN